MKVEMKKPKTELKDLEKNRSREKLERRKKLISSYTRKKFSLKKICHRRGSHLEKKCFVLLL